MTVKLNHTIVMAHDHEKSALFLTELLGLVGRIPVSQSAPRSIDGMTAAASTSKIPTAICSRS